MKHQHTCTSHKISRPIILELLPEVIALIQWIIQVATVWWLIIRTKKCS